MTIQTVGEAVSAAILLYQGRDKHLAPKWIWWRDQLGADRPLAAITADDVDNGIRELIESPAQHYTKNNGVGLGTKRRAHSTINRYVAALGSLYKILKQTRRIARSFPTPSFKGLRLPEGGGRVVSVDIADVKRFVEAARLTRNKKLAAFVAVACTTGLRRSNIQSIKWGDLDLKMRTLDVPRTKNGAPVRSILPAWVCTELRKIRPDNPEPFWEVFGPKDFRRAWTTALELADLPSDWTPHSCRHIAASVLAQSGASLPVIMGLLNHRSPMMALRYSHLNTKALEGAMAAAWE